MKKILAVLFAMILTFALAGCGRDSDAGESSILDFRSILDLQLDRIFSLGDHRADIEAAIGDPISIEAYDGFYIHDYQGGLTVFYENDRAVVFEGENGRETGRFEILGYRIGTARTEISNNFEFNEELSISLSSPTFGWYIYAYEQFYDESGNLTNRENAYVMSGIYWVERPTETYVRWYIELMR